MAGTESSLKPRLASRADLDDLLALEQRCFSYDRIGRRSFRRLLTSETARICVVSEDAQLLAYALVLSRRNSAYLRIYSMAVAPEARGKGLAKLLIQAVLRQAQQANFAGVRLEVKCDNHAAIQLYQQLGFETIDLLPNYYDDGTDGFKMQLSF